MTEVEHKNQCAQAKQISSPLASAFDQCPSVLFSFLTDVEAAKVACALCIPNFLSSKRYEIKRELPFMLVLADLHSGVARNVRYVASEAPDDAIGPSMLPSSVTFLHVHDSSPLKWRVRDLPRSLIHFRYSCCDGQAGTFALGQKASDWPPGLTTFDFYPDSMLALPALPSTLRTLLLGGQLPPGDLPLFLTTLETRQLNRPISQLPPNLTNLQFHLADEVKLQELNDLPPSLTHLTVNADDFRECNEQDSGTVKLPLSLRYLDIEFPLRALHSLPPSLETLAVYNDVDVPIRHANLRSLQVPFVFNHPIRAADLPNLQILTVGDSFMHPLDDLPPQLTELTIDGGSQEYDHDLDHLPSSLQKLAIHRGFKRPLDKLPSSLRSLFFVSEFNHPLNHLPCSLTELDFRYARHFNQPLDRLPPQLRVLKVGPLFNQPLDALPSGLTQLELCSGQENWNRPLDRLPASLQVLSLAHTFNQRLDHLPPSLTVLKLWTCLDFNQPLNQLPDSLKCLWLHNRYNQSIARLPRVLTELKLGDAYNHPLPLVDSHSPACAQGVCEPSYPIALRSLRLGESFNQPLVLPSSLTKLVFRPSGAFEHPLPVSSLPIHLTSLRLPARYPTLYPEYGDVKNLRQRCPLVRVSCSCVSGS